MMAAQNAIYEREFPVFLVREKIWHSAIVMILEGEIQSDTKSYMKEERWEDPCYRSLGGQSELYPAASPFDAAGSPMVVPTLVKLPSLRTENALIVWSPKFRT